MGQEFEATKPDTETNPGWVSFKVKFKQDQLPSPFILFPLIASVLKELEDFEVQMERGVIVNKIDETYEEEHIFEVRAQIEKKGYTLSEILDNAGIKFSKDD